MSSLFPVPKLISITLVAFFIMVVTLTTRLININYNSAFNDEAIYIIVGLMGIFESDWWTYNASNWIPGVQFLYPSLTAFFYNFSGLVGSRLINVMLGVFMVEVIFFLTVALQYKLTSKITNITLLSGLVAGAIVGGSEVSHSVSRLATYDMPSFTLLFLGLFLLIHSRPVTNGRRYFAASLALSFSYLFKIITGLYMPLILAYFYFYAKSLGKKNFIFWKKYFLWPFLAVLALFIFSNFNSLKLYYSSQNVLESANLEQILDLIWDNSKYVLILALIGSFGMLLKKQFHTLVLLILAAFWVVLFHIFTERSLSLDKHLLLMISFLAVIAGVGITNLISQIKFKTLRVVTTFVLVFCLIVYWYLGYVNLQKFNNKWQDLSLVEQKMRSVVEGGDKVLAESGAAIILATYYQNYPPNTTTFDWLEYRGHQGEIAYIKAVSDGYFDVIELEGEYKPKSDANRRLSQVVLENLNQNYKLSFKNNGFYIYERVY